MTAEEFIARLSDDQLVAIHMAGQQAFSIDTDKVRAELFRCLAEIRSGRFQYRVGNLAVLRKEGGNFQRNPMLAAEIVQYFDQDTYMVIAWIDYNQDDTQTPDIRFVGDRPFAESVDWSVFRELCVTGLGLVGTSPPNVTVG